MYMISLHRRPRRFVFVIVTLLLFINGCASTPKEKIVQPADLEPKSEVGLKIEPKMVRPDAHEESMQSRAKKKNNKVDSQPNTAIKQEPSVEKALVPSENKPKVPLQVKVETVVPKPKPVVSTAKVIPKKVTQPKKERQVDAPGVKIAAVIVIAPAEIKQEELTSKIIPDLEVALDRLPLKVDESWTLIRESNLKGSCALSYRRLLIEDGQGETPVDVIVQKNQVLFKTRSNIDLGYEGVGVTIDANPQIAVENIVNHTSISFKKRYQTLISEMKEGEVARLTLGFWPTWPVTQTYNVNFELGQFALGHKALMKCTELEKELK